MVETYDDAAEKRRKRNRESVIGREDGEFDATSPADFSGEQLKEKYQDVLSFLELGSEQGDRSVNVGDRSGLSNILDLDIDTANQLEVLGLLAKTSISQLEVLFDIADYTRHGSTVTVSGATIIDDAESPELLVPSSSSGNIPTRTLMIRSAPDNNEAVYFGDDGVEPQLGFALLPGESMTLDIDLRELEIYISSAEPGQVIQMMGFY